MNNPLDTDLKQLEQQLANLNPSPLSPETLARMEDAMNNWEAHLPVEQKVVPFETESKSPSEFDSASPAKSSRFHVWSAAAAVALMAAVGAVFTIGQSEPNPLSPTNELTQATVTDSSLSPSPIASSFSHNLVNASQEGITYGADDQPYKVLKIEYTKEVIRKDANGNEVTHKEPAVEVILLPVDVH